MTEYTVVIGACDDDNGAVEFIKDVNAKLAEGWVFVGGVSSTAELDHSFVSAHGGDIVYSSNLILTQAMMRIGVAPGITKSTA